MEVKMEKITPEKAQRYLNRNTSNRKLREGVVEKYATDMKSGRWTECPAPIAFYENGDVADGQHRLWAIVESEMPQEFLVARGLDRSAGLNIDTGLNRTVVDNAKIAGLTGTISNEHIAIAKYVEEGVKQSKVRSNSQKLDMLEKHREAAEWTVSHGPRGKGIRISLVLAAIARAWYHEADKEKLARFCRLLENGMGMGEHETAAVALRNYLLANGRSDLAGLWRENFLKVQNAISHFMQGKRLMVIKGIEKEAYPLKRSGHGR